MAMYNTDQATIRPGQRNVSMMLVRSGKTSPSVKYIVAAAFATDAKLKTVWENGVLFEHKWGGPKGQDVTIPMGRIVSAGKPVKNYQMDEYNMEICLPGMTDNKNWIGVAPYNYTKDYWQADRFGGNMPSVLTDKLIVLPYIPSVAAAATRDIDGIVAEENALTKGLKMPWGAVINPAGQANTMPYAGGDYLMASASGRFVKWDEANPWDVVGQIYEIDLNQEPHGFLKWVLWDEAALREDSPYDKGLAPDMGGWAYDSNYVEGNNGYPGYLTPYTTLNDATGIPGLHDGEGGVDGFGINDTVIKDTVVESSVTATAGTAIMMQLKDYHGAAVKQIFENSVVLKVDGVTVDAANYTVDHLEGKVTFTLTADLTAAKITADYQMKRAGIPSYLDFKGVVGSMTVLLLK